MASKQNRAAKAKAQKPAAAKTYTDTLPLVQALGGLTRPDGELFTGEDSATLAGGVEGLNAVYTLTAPPAFRWTKTRTGEVELAWAVSDRKAWAAALSHGDEVIRGGVYAAADEDPARGPADDLQDRGTPPPTEVIPAAEMTRVVADVVLGADQTDPAGWQGGDFGAAPEPPPAPQWQPACWVENAVKGGRSPCAALPVPPPPAPAAGLYSLSELLDGTVAAEGAARLDVPAVPAAEPPVAAPEASPEPTSPPAPARVDDPDPLRTILEDVVAGRMTVEAACHVIRSMGQVKPVPKAPKQNGTATAGVKGFNGNNLEVRTAVLKASGESPEVLARTNREFLSLCVCVSKGFLEAPVERDGVKTYRVTSAGAEYRRRLIESNGSAAL